MANTTLYPIADAGVYEPQPDLNYGPYGDLYVRTRDGQNARSFLMFHLGTLPADAEITRAVLRLNCYSVLNLLPGVSDVQARRTDDSWSEYGITWKSSRYMARGTVEDTTPPAVGWVEWTVTPFVQAKWVGNKIVSICLTCAQEWYDSATRNSSYRSKEYDGNGPELYIEYMTPEPPDVKITSLNYPAEARVGDAVEISWLLKNEGGDGGVPQWFRIRDMDTGGLVPPGEVGFALVPGGVTGATIYPTMPKRDINWWLKAETGYGSTITDSKSFAIWIEPEDVVIYVWDQTSGSYLGGDWGKATLDGVPKDPSGGTAIFHNIEVGRHTISIDVPGYDFDRWDSGSGDSWVEVLIDSPNSSSTGITTQSGGPGLLRAYVTEKPPVLYVNSVTISAPSSVEEDTAFTISGYVRDQFGAGMGGVTVYLYRNGSYIGSDGTSSSGYYSKSHIIPSPGVYELTARADSKEASRNITIESALPSSANVTVKGRATGGYPTPTIRLYVYDKGVQVGYKDFSPISIGTWYTYEKVVTGAGSHSVYGRMRLRNALGSFYKNTETVEFELG